MMKCFVWNVRGLDGESRHSTVIQWINHNRPLIDGLLETCVKQHKINFINVSAPSGMTFWFKSLRYGRKWKNNCGLGPKTDTVQTYVKTDQIMVCGVLFPVTNTSITMGFVYARNVSTERRELWDLIKNLSPSSLFQSSPWIFLRGFQSDFIHLWSLLLVSFSHPDWRPFGSTRLPLYFQNFWFSKQRLSVYLDKQEPYISQSPEAW